MSAAAPARISPDTDVRPLPLGEVLGMRETHKMRLYEAVITALVKEKRLRGLTEEMLAIRLGKTTEEIDRFLASPDGWTFEAIIDILTAGGLEVGLVKIGRR